VFQSAVHNFSQKVMEILRASTLVFSFLLIAILSLFYFPEKENGCQLSDWNGQESNVVYLSGGYLPGTSLCKC